MLPAQPTRLIGREEDIAAATQLLLRDDIRLVTFTGPPGTGKTRLALEVATRLRDGFRDGVWFIELAPITDPSLVLSTIVRTLAVREGDKGLTESLQAFLQDKEALLVLDNFEQVLDAAPLVADILAACPNIKIAVTSRAPLRLRWEHEFPVPPLQLPDLVRLPGLKELQGTPAVALFVERAQAAQPEFQLQPENALPIAEICTRLDGLPLAIELAAARTRVFPPKAMLARLDSRLSLLTTALRDVPDRHRTLRGSIGWSYSLLQPAERTLFRRAGVFLGGWDLNAIEGVCDGPTRLGIEASEGIASLTDNNLVWRDPAGSDETRFRMLETVREYALECLAESREMDALRGQHASYFLSLIDRAAAGLTGPEEAVWPERLEREHDNLRAALRWSIDQGEVDQAVRAVCVLWRFWWVRAHLTEGRQWLREVLDLPQLEPASVLRGRALTVAGLLATWQGDYTPARVLLSEACAIAEKAEDDATTALALTFLGRAARDQGADEEACALGQRAVDMFRRSHDPWGLALSSHFLGLAILRRDPSLAQPLFEESASLFQSIGARWDRAMPLRGLGDVAYAQGEYGAAQRLFEESMALFRERGDEWSVAMLLHELGHAVEAQGDRAQAARLFGESLRLWRRIGVGRGVATSLAGLAGVAAGQGKAATAARLFGAVEAMGAASSVALEPSDLQAYQRHVAAARSRMAEEAFAQAWEEGKAMPAQDAITLALELLAPAATGLTGPLTQREREVAALVAQGMTNRQIATTLWISEGTANLHVKHILAKLGFASRAQIAVWVVQQEVSP